MALDTKRSSTGSTKTETYTSSIKEKKESMIRNTTEEWKHIPAGKSVRTGFSGDMATVTAPEEEGHYTLYEIGTDQNYHVGWQWVKEEEKKDGKSGKRRTGGKRTGDVPADSPVPDGDR